MINQHKHSIETSPIFIIIFQEDHHSVLFSGVKSFQDPKSQLPAFCRYLRDVHLERRITNQIISRSHTDLGFGTVTLTVMSYTANFPFTCESW